MRLRKFRARAYRCIHDSGEIRVGDLAAFVGRNESGKTTILQALTLLNKDQQVSELDLCDEMTEDLKQEVRLAEGDFELAEKLLDRRYTFSGKVVSGNKLGRTIGIPTANIWVPKSNLPIRGVYAVKAFLKGETFNGIANMGVRPTVGGTSPVLEIHIFDFNKNIYGQRIEVEFYKKIREEKKFNDLNELKDQISKDIELAKEFLN